MCRAHVYSKAGKRISIDDLVKQVRIRLDLAVPRTGIVTARF